MSERLYISMYHYTRDLKHSRYPHIKGLDYELFERQLQFFKENFNALTMEEVIDAYANKGPLPERALLLTFDDGYIDNYTVALPLLKKYDLQGSFFIPAKTFCENKLLDVNKIHFILAVAEEKGVISSLAEKIMTLIDEYREGRDDIMSNKQLYETYAIANRFDDKDTVFCKRVLQTGIPEDIRNAISSRLFEEYVGIREEDFARELYMNRDQIELMKKEGMFIGVHGYDHYWLGNLDKEKMEEDIDKALSSLKGLIDENCWVMNYPYGSYNDNVIDCVRQKGCALGLSTRVDIATPEDERYALPRLDCNDFPPKSENYKRY